MLFRPSSGTSSGSRNVMFVAAAVVSVDAAAASPAAGLLTITPSLAPTERERTLVTVAPSAEVCAACGLA
eukprot:scaffold42468_cov40-Phaeocystis_antarctica.AAC.1